MAQNPLHDRLCHCGELYWRSAILPTLCKLKVTLPPTSLIVTHNTSNKGRGWLPLIRFLTSAYNCKVTSGTQEIIT